MSTWTRPLQTLGPQGFLSHLKPPKPRAINPPVRLARPLSRAVSFIAIPPNFIPLQWFRGLIPFSSSPTPRPSMCKSRRAVMASRPTSRSSSSFPITDSGGYPRTTNSNSSSRSGASVASKTSSSASLVTLRNSLKETPTLYPFSEISAATKNFVASSSSSSSRRCSLRGKDAVVLQRPFRGDPAALPARLVALCKSHHSSLVRLLGASLAGGSIYLVYEHSPGAPLADCLRNPRNPNFTPLSSWMSRIQVAADLAQGLDYIHHHSATIHNRIKASNILVIEPHFRAKICHFGAAELAGDVQVDAEETKAGEIESASPPRRSGTRATRFEGTRVYIAPEVIAGGRISRRSDVFAFGVVLLELLSGEEPVRYRYDRASGGLERFSIIETARRAIDAAEKEEMEERYKRMRGWVDPKLGDSFPVEAAEKLIRVALRCVEAEAGTRPDMIWVAGKLSKQLIEAEAWDEKVRVPADFSVSLAPR